MRAVKSFLPLVNAASAAAEAGARLVLASTDQIHAPAERDAEPPVLIDGPQEFWAAALRPR